MALVRFSLQTYLILCFVYESQLFSNTSGHEERKAQQLEHIYL